uniref:Right handed beta helix domain-containing protein n=1 Tax=Chenopodium quinoa TaxID=63459 RepID=A0A803KUE3_CHEQI
MHGGTLIASDNFATDRYLIELSASPPSQISKENTTSSTDQNLSSSSYNFEYISFTDLMLDCNYKGGGIAVINTLRVSIDNCYIVHFMSEGIRVECGHETLTRTNKGIIVSGQANLLSGVHCYNKATGFGGTGIYLKLAGLTQTRIVNSYLDYTGIVAEDPGVANGVNIVDNIFAGSGNGIDIVQLDGPFGDVDQILIDRNSVKGMNAKVVIESSVATPTSVYVMVDQGFGG